MKKLLIIIFILIWLLNSSYAASNNCWKIWWDINNKSLTSLLKDCQPDGTLEWKSKNEIFSFLWIFSISTTSNNWYEITDVTGKILSIIKKLLILASILAIWWIVYAGIMFTTAYWSDEKHKKWKDVIKWSIIWFVVALISQQLINAIINLIYWVSSK